MNVIFASSRGLGLEHITPPNVTVSATSGGKLHELKAAAELIIPPPYGLVKRRKHIYFLCGIPDLTELEKSNSSNYRECVFNGDPLKVADEYCQQLSNCQSDILNRGALPIFCTIPNMNIALYNNFMLSKRITSYLQYQNEYSRMQSNLETAVNYINSKIPQINKKIQVSTPFLHDTIRQRTGRKNKKYFVYHWDKYYDGLHAPKDPKKPMILLNKWMDIIKNAIRLNESLEDSEDEESEEELPWRHPSKRPRVE